MKEFIATSRIGLEVINSTEKDGIIKDIFLADEVSDGYHTMSELYEHRMALNAFLFRMMYLLDVDQRGKDLAELTPLVMKAKFHNDGTMFEGGYFVVYAHTNHGDISYHYKLEHWDKFRIPEKDRVPWGYDGHTAKDVVERLLKL